MRKTKKGDKSNFLNRLGNGLRDPKIGLIPFFGSRSGFSLLEIVLALAILAGSLAALGEVMRLSDQNAEKARDETQAELLADSVMSEIVSGARTLDNVNNATFDSSAEPPWNYSIEVTQTDYTELVSVHVRVMQQVASELQPARCDLVRWLPATSSSSTDTSQQDQQSQQNNNTSTGKASTSATRSSTTGGTQ
jgi:type II secretion system protein I